MKYAAFISYSHKDKAWGEKLHRALERYRVPKRIRGIEGRDGPVADRIFPVFRDRDELPSSSDLNEQIAVALRESATLIVVCSPRAVASRWVNEEIRLFKAMGRANRILAVIVDGVPNASDTRGASPGDECFPDALRYRVGPDGALTSERVEPVAADVRPEGDGEENARLKVIAGVLGIGFDQLRQRDLEAQRSRLRKLVAISGAIALALTGLLVASVYFARQAREERNRALRHLGDSYAARARDFAGQGQYDTAVRMALAAARLSEGSSALAAEVLRWAGPMLNLRARFPINVHPAARFAMSPDERLLASPVGSDALAWDPQSGELRFTFRGHSRAVRTVEFSPDGARLLTGSEDGTAAVWDARTGQAIGSVKAGDPIWFARFWQNGAAVVTATSTGTLQIWDAQTFRERANLTLDHEEAREALGRPDVPEAGVIGGIAALGLSRDGRKIALGGRAGGVALFVFDASGGTTMKWLDTGWFDDMLFTPDSAQLITSPGALGVTLWNAETGERLSGADANALPGPVAYSRDGTLLAVAGGAGFVKVTNLSTGETFDFSDPELTATDALAFSRDGRLIAAARMNGPIEVYELGEESAPATIFTGHLETVEALEFSADGKLLYSSSLDGTIRQWHVKWPQTPERASVPLMAHRATDVTTAGGRVFVSGNEGLRSIDLATLQITDENALVPGTSGLYVSHTGDRVAMGSGRGAWIMTATTRQVVKTEELGFAMPEFSAVGPLAWSADDMAVAGAAGDSGVVIWHAQTGRVIREIRTGRGLPVEALDFSRDGSRLVLRYTDGAVEVRGVAGTSIIRLGGPASRFTGFAVSPAADLILTAGEDGNLALWQLQTGEAAGVLMGHGRGPQGHAILAVGFSADGRYIHSRSHDDTARFWDAATRANIFTTTLDAAGFYACVTFLPGNKQVAINSMNHGGTKIFDLATGLETMFLPDASNCPAFTPDRRFAAAPTYRGAIVWDVSRLTLSGEELIARACDRAELPATARTFTKLEADRDALVRNLRLDAGGHEIDMCTGKRVTEPSPPRGSR